MIWSILFQSPTSFTTYDKYKLNIYKLYARHNEVVEALRKQKQIVSVCATKLLCIDKATVTKQNRRRETKERDQEEGGSIRMWYLWSNENMVRVKTPVALATILFLCSLQSTEANFISFLKGKYPFNHIQYSYSCHHSYVSTANRIIHIFNDKIKIK